MRTRFRLGSLVLLAALPALTIGGCDFFKPKVDKDKLEEAMANWLKAHDLAATDIHCPDDQIMENGNKFECTCKVHGSEIPVTVTVTDQNSGEVSWEPKYTTAKSEVFENEIRHKKSLEGHDLTLDCHDHVWVSIPDSKWTCDVSDNGDGKKYLATVTFTDGEGNHEMALEPK